MSDEILKAAGRMATTAEAIVDAGLSFDRPLVECLQLLSLLERLRSDVGAYNRAVSVERTRETTNPQSGGK